MVSRLPPAAIAAALFLVSLPAFAIETVALPQNPDGTPSFQTPDVQAPQPQSRFSTDQNGDLKVDGLGSFHFSATQDPYWPGDPDRTFQTGHATGSAYGDAKTPGSEFYNPFGH